MFLKNAWYAAGWAHEVEGDRLLARTILGEPLVLFRGPDGAPAALIDRCGHRFAPLSMGRREGGRLRCMYHGLVFDPTGTCVEEPGCDAPSSGTSVRSFPAVQRDKLIWVWMGEGARADPALVPDCHWQDDPGWRALPAYIHYDADYRLIMDNQLDFSHLSFVHETTLGGSRAIAETAPKIEKIDGGLRITRWYLNEPKIAPYLEGLTNLSGPIDRWNIYDWLTAGNVLNMDSGSAAAGTGAPEGRRAPEALQFHATQVLTPETDKTSHFFWSYGHNFHLEDEALTRRLADRIATGFEEDRVMVEAQQQVVDRAPPEARMGAIPVDAGLIQARRLLERRIAEETA
jgi:phenylpropionate dioxygenase-like ring-hydroxylating dioxygenase large terminal subunit